MESSQVNNYCWPSSLREAIESRNYGYLEKYLANENNIHSRETEGFTPLQIALKIDDIKMVRFLLEHRADPNRFYLHEDWKGCSPLHFALSRRSNEMAMLLIEYGADLFAMCYNKIPAIYYAIKYNRVQIIRYSMRNGISPDSLIDHDTSLLTCAVKEGNIRIVKCILEYGPNVNSHHNQQAIVEAIYGYDNYSKRLVKMLYNYGFTLQPADVHSKLILAAIENGHYEAVKNLLELGVNPDQDILFDSYEEPILYVAVKCNQIKIVQLLLEYGANVNKFSDNDGRLPLLTAASQSNLYITRLLLKYGAKVIRTDSLFFALVETLEYCERHLDERLDRVKTKIVKLLISEEADINAKFITNECTPIFGAIETGLPSAVQVLLDHGADVCKINEMGFTAFLYARHAVDYYIKNQFLLNPLKRQTILDLRSQVAEKLERHIYLIHKIGYPVAQVDLLKIDERRKDYLECENMCKIIDDEFEYIKATKIDNSYVTLYRFLSSTDEEAAKFVENDVFLKNLKAMLRRPSKFTGYAIFIRKKLTAALRQLFRNICLAGSWCLFDLYPSHDIDCHQRCVKAV
ncbi:putative ankyrin repeat protein RF_0381 [Chelonus insularis]|uniref:putative ankyrin repeat protein RF_0381 n=1 Tax=Chelonus insularis TaxID=460826 RepID=UPI00158C4C28|nr:putative ankyrin repeat protein RF_0381 [Chelonus insularis]